MKKFAETIRMAYNIIISVEAQTDTNDAYCYYESQQTGLGERFLNEISHFYKKLEKHPEYYSFTSETKTIRSIALKIFPYKIIYEIDGDEVIVFAVYHFRNNPDQLYKRL